MEKNKQYKSIQRVMNVQIFSIVIAVPSWSLLKTLDKSFNLAPVFLSVEWMDIIVYNDG